MNMRHDKPPLGPIEPGQLPLVQAPDEIWRSIQASLSEDRIPVRKVFRWWQFATAFSLVAGAVLLWISVRPKPASWEVVRLNGSPSVGSKRVEDTGRIAVGEWLQTDSSSRARIGIGAIGSVEVEPNSRVRLLVAKSNEHRLALARGEISATVSAPPRLFFVDTPASTAVDLGCAYTMRTDEAGSGTLFVSAGWVALEWKGRESLVPAGAMCRTKASAGPGTPYFGDSSEAFRQALLSFDFANGGAGALQEVLSQSRLRDTLTLWHLLSRVDMDQRLRVFDRMVELTPLPQGLAREKLLDLDKDSLTRWREELAWKW
jgi:hypothetical protein